MSTFPCNDHYKARKLDDLLEYYMNDNSGNIMGDDKIEKRYLTLRAVAK